ncbi:MAG: phosphoribosylamine--glycine ligase [Patescibacteria group bacterium]|nr:phosphoribosylamine--glycine ligase [Patescibacteria group bacterium]
MKILVIGSGGREHALLWKLSQSPKVTQLFVAPGNAGTAAVATNVQIGATEVARLVEFAIKETVDLTIVGPDNAIAVGVIDAFREKGLKVFGPTKAAGQIESSKSFAKEIMQAASVPTAKYQTFADYGTAWLYVQRQNLPIVVKADGLALGKGVFVCHTLEEAGNALQKLIPQGTVVIEEFLEGNEVSIHAICDEKSFVLFPPSRDHKTIGENSTGPNTGGMGVIAPVETPGTGLGVIANQIVAPVLATLKGSATFTGCLYPGLKMTKTGPYVLEFNARFGDPETEVYMRLLKTDLVDLIMAAVDNKLSTLSVEWHSGFVVDVVLAAEGYPGEYRRGDAIEGVQQASDIKGVVIFHGGTQSSGSDLITSGGRVLHITALGDTLQRALDTAYKAVALIHFQGMQYRRDIGVSELRAHRFSLI